MDECDLASQQEAAHIKQALDNFDRHLRKKCTEHEQCAECGEIIPAARRKAVPGCDLCISCQNYFEQGGGMWP